MGTPISEKRKCKTIVHGAVLGPSKSAASGGPAL